MSESANNLVGRGLVSHSSHELFVGTIMYIPALDRRSEECHLPADVVSRENHLPRASRFSFGPDGWVTNRHR